MKLRQLRMQRLHSLLQHSNLQQLHSSLQQQLRNLQLHSSLQQLHSSQRRNQQLQWCLRRLQRRQQEPSMQQ